MADPQLFEIGRTSPFYAMQAIAAQDAARRAAGAQLYQMYGGPQNPPMAQPAPQPGGGGLPPPPPGTPQGGPMPPQPGANPAPQGIPPQQRAGMPPQNPGMMPPGQMPPPPMGGAPGAPPPGGSGAMPMQRPLASPKPFQAMPSAPPPGPPQAGQIGAPPAAPPQQPDAGLLQPGKQFNLQALVQQLKGSGVPPDKVMDMLDQLTPVMNQQNQQELRMLQAQTTAARAAEQFYKDRLTIELMGRRVGVQEG